MGEFKNIRNMRRNAKSAESEMKTLGKAIEERGNKTIKIPNISDRKTGKMMIEHRNLSKRAPKMMESYIKKRNRFIGKTGLKAALVGAAAYGGKRLADDYDKSTEKYAGYVKRVGDSLSRKLNFTRKINEIKVSAKEAGKAIKKELRKDKPDVGELGHLNAKKVKESLEVKNKDKAKVSKRVSGAVIIGGTGLYIKKKVDEAVPHRSINYMR